MGNKERFEQLLILFANNKISQEEYRELLELIRLGPDEEIYHSMDKVWEKASSLTEVTDTEKEDVYKRITADSRFKQTTKNFTFSSETGNHWYKIAIAASILLFITLGLYVYPEKTEIKKQVINKVQPKTKDIPPGGNKAILTLADGSKVILEDANNGILAKQAGINIKKTKDNELEYTFTEQPVLAEGKEQQELYNIIETPVGGKYQINLPDGSRVWLNSKSSLRFPVSFTQHERVVELTGEAYFEIAKNKAKTFKVISDKQTVEVLGTHFNINAYADEPWINTTLLEGKIKVSQLSTNESQLLSPGQQAKVNETIKVITVDPQDAVAWKDGFFYFDKADIRTVMRQLERWYGITVRYEGNTPSKQFAGAIERNLTLMQVLEILEQSEVHFRLEGKEVIIMP